MGIDYKPDQWILWVPPLLWNRRQFLARVAGVGVLLSVALAFLLPTRYQSTARLMPPDSQSKSQFALMASALAGGTPAPTMGLASLVNSRSPDAAFLAILGSRTAQDDLINRFDLRKEYNCRYYQSARKILTGHTTLQEDKQTGVVTISVTDSSPLRARDLVSGYVDELNKLVVVMDTSSAHRERVFLGERLREVGQDLAKASDQLSRFSSRNATIDVQHQAAATLDATARLQAQFIAAQSELHSLQAIYASENARVREAQARVNTLQREMQKMTGSGQTPAASLTADQPYPSLRQLPLLGATYSDLYRRVAVEQALYETLTKDYELAKVEEAKEIPAVTLLDPPDFPEKRSFPPRILIVSIGILLALIGGAAWIIVNEIAENSPEAYPVLTAALTMCKSRLGRGHRIASGVLAG